MNTPYDFHTSEGDDTEEVPALYPCPWCREPGYTDCAFCGGALFVEAVETEEEG